MPLDIVRRLEAAYKALTSSEIIKNDPPAVAGAGQVTPVEGVFPWAFRYPYGVNLSIRPRGTEPLSFSNLRGIAKNCEMMRLAIQLKTEQIRGLDWDIVVKPGFNPRTLETRRKSIKNFFRRPDPLNDLNFNDWIKQWIEDLIVLDAATIWWLQDRAGRTIGATVIDGGTIRPCITDEGYVPFPPDPAYAQVLDGRVHGTYSRDEMLYCQYNPRSESVYGMSHVEMVIMSAHISMKRQLDNLSRYTEGNVPEQLLIAPPEWSTSQIREVQDYLDAYLSGDVAKKHKLKLIPGGTTLKELRQQDMTVAIDDWIARIISAVFGVAPHVLFMKTRAGGSAGSNEIVDQQQSDVGQDPFKKYIMETFTEKIIVGRFGEEGLAFAFLSDKTNEEKANIAKAKTMVPIGAIGIDELRQAEGKEPLGIPAYIQMANGLLFLTPSVIADIKSGKVNFIDAGGVPHTIDSAASGAAPASSAPKPSGGGMSQQAKKALFDMEVGQFRTVVISDLKKGKPADKKFVFNFIPENMASVIRLGVERCSDLDEVREFFSKVNYEAISVRESAVRVCFDLSKWLEADIYKWMRANGFRHSQSMEMGGSLFFPQSDRNEGEIHEMTSEGLPEGVQILYGEVPDAIQ